MSELESKSYDDLQALLGRLGARRGAHEVHALYLGALTSTLISVEPAKLLDVILQDATLPPQGVADTHAATGVLFGYWNTVVAAREAGEVHFAPGAPPIGETSDRDELLAFAQRRAAELRAYALGVATVGDDTSEWSEHARTSFELLMEQESTFERYVERLTRRSDESPAYHLQLGRILCELAELAETMIQPLMDRNELTRMSILHGIPDGQASESGSSSAPKIGRNERCACGSGKKYKRCCGAPD